MAVYEILSSRHALASGISLDKSAINTIVDSGVMGVNLFLSFEVTNMPLHNKHTVC